MAKISREEWIQGAAEVFGRDGAEQLRIEKLAKELGVSKGSFYWHFKDRDELLEAVVSTWEKHGTLEIIRQVSAAGGPPEERLWHLMQIAFSAPLAADAFEIEVRTFAMHSKMAEAMVARVDEARLKFVTNLLVEQGLSRKAAKWRAALFYRTLVGDYLMHRYGSRPLSKPAMQHLHAFLTSPSSE